MIVLYARLIDRFSEYNQTYNLDLFHKIKLTNVFFIWKWVFSFTSRLVN